MLTARAPFDLLIANILAGPLVELAPSFAASVAPGASVVLAGLLDTQADAVIAAYEAQGMTVAERGAGEWCVLVLQAAAYPATDTDVLELRAHGGEARRDKFRG